MVRFEKDSLIIEIKAGCPLEAWVNLQEGLCDVVRNVNHESICDNTFYAVIDFVRELIPEWDTAVKMKK
jgi:hypothetical protein